MIDHTGVIVSDFEQGKAFYSKTLAAIGYELLMQVTAAQSGSKDFAGFGEEGKPDFWVSGGTPNQPPMHVAFRVKNRATVDAFYQAAMTAGAIDNGAPGLRPHYHPNYYSAFVRDADGHNIEAVCHEEQN